MTAKMQLGEGDGSQHSEMTGTQHHVMFCIKRGGAGRLQVQRQDMEMARLNAWYDWFIPSAQFEILHCTF